MKRIILLLFLIMIIGSLPAEEKNVKPVFLDQPADWKFERMEFPPGFAPRLNYEGFEELRFAPGMFDPQSDNYFSYIFVISLKNINIEKINLQDFLTHYFKGLCTLVAEGKKFKIDPSKIRAEVKSIDLKKVNKFRSYQAGLLILDSFNNGEEIDLNMDIKAQNQRDGVCLIFIASAKNRDSKIFKKLKDIRDRLLQKPAFN